MMFDVNVLLYGDHRDLARRCLESIQKTIDPKLAAVVRIGLNAVTPQVKDEAWRLASKMPVITHIYWETSNRNVWKYPMMRKMIRDRERPVEAPYVMWFDDDSFLVDRSDRLWWSKAEIATRGPQTVTGSVYKLTKGFRGPQFSWIEGQPWFKQRNIQGIPRFAQGAWWMAKTIFLDRWDYPFPELRHNGGDSMLGELLHQQGHTIKHWNTGVAINADHRGAESAAKRRGDVTAWPGERGCTGTKHQEFEVTVQTFMPGGT